MPPWAATLPSAAGRLALRALRWCGADQDRASAQAVACRAGEWLAEPFGAALDRAGRQSAVRRQAGVGLLCVSLFTPFPPQPCPIFQALPDLALKATFGWVVELLPAERFRKIILAGKSVWCIVIVVVALAVTL
jgi:hypothetical protein